MLLIPFNHCRIIKQGNILVEVVPQIRQQSVSFNFLGFELNIPFFVIVISRQVILKRVVGSADTDPMVLLRSIFAQPLFIIVIYFSTQQQSRSAADYF